jgi:hypothetical protein
MERRDDESGDRRDSNHEARSSLTSAILCDLDSA